MTPIETWNLARSDFNHVWLKNRLIVTLNRALQGLGGQVQDDAIGQDLSALLADWPTRRADAIRLLDEYAAAGLLPHDKVKLLLPNAPIEIADWLARVIDLRKGAGEDCRELVDAARNALHELDAKIRRFSAGAVETGQIALPPKAAESVRDLRTAADRLAQTFSGLWVSLG